MKRLIAMTGLFGRDPTPCLFHQPAQLPMRGLLDRARLFGAATSVSLRDIHRVRQQRNFQGELLDNIITAPEFFFRLTPHRAINLRDLIPTTAEDITVENFERYVSHPIAETIDEQISQHTSEEQRKGAVIVAGTIPFAAPVRHYTASAEYEKIYPHLRQAPIINVAFVLMYDLRGRLYRIHYVLKQTVSHLDFSQTSGCHMDSFQSINIGKEKARPISAVHEVTECADFAKLKFQNLEYNKPGSPLFDSPHGIPLSLLICLDWCLMDNASVLSKMKNAPHHVPIGIVIGHGAPRFGELLVRQDGIVVICDGAHKNDSLLLRQRSDAPTHHRTLPSSTFEDPALFDEWSMDGIEPPKYKTLAHIPHREHRNHFCVPGLCFTQEFRTHTVFKHH